MGMHLDTTKFVGDFAKIAAGLKDLPDEAERIIVAAQRKAANELVSAAKAAAPVRTGRLQLFISAGVTKDKKDNKVTVVSVKTGKRAKATMKRHGLTNMPYYARFVEFGTEKMKAEPFMRPAWESTKDDLLDIIVRELTAGIARAARKSA